MKLPLFSRTGAYRNGDQLTLEQYEGYRMALNDLRRLAIDADSDDLRMVWDWLDVELALRLTEQGLERETQSIKQRQAKTKKPR